jgi:hypothetical protein
MVIKLCLLSLAVDRISVSQTGKMCNGGFFLPAGIGIYNPEKIWYDTENEREDRPYERGISPDSHAAG